jgi:hypothetical protein
MNLGGGELLGRGILLGEAIRKLFDLTVKKAASLEV